MSDTKELECPWESGVLGTSVEHAEAAPEDVERDLDEALALQMISIRLPRRMIDDLKFIAAREGLGYQPLIRRVLTRFTTAEFRAIAREQLKATDGCEAEDTSMPRAAVG